MKRTKVNRRQSALHRVVLTLLALTMVVCGVYFIVWSVIHLSQPTDGTAYSDASSEVVHEWTTTPTAVTTTTTAAPTGGTLVDGHYIQNPAQTAWNLILANPWNPLPEGYDEDLERQGGLRGNSSETVDVRIYDSLKRMLADGAAYNLSLASGYRSVAKQTDLFEGRVAEWMKKGKTREEAEAEVLKDTARPGTSEHNTGLAVDLLGDSYTWLSQSFANTEAYAWLVSHCAEYGFILRYPEGREDITGYTFEPWHYRYVGPEAATYIMEHNLTLEEYLEQIDG